MKSENLTIMDIKTIQMIVSKKIGDNLLYHPHKSTIFIGQKKLIDLPNLQMCTVRSKYNNANKCILARCYGND